MFLNVLLDFLLQIRRSDRVKTSGHDRGKLNWTACVIKFDFDAFVIKYFLQLFSNGTESIISRRNSFSCCNATVVNKTDFSFLFQIIPRIVKRATDQPNIFKSPLEGFFKINSMAISICNNCQDSHFIIETNKMDLQWLKSDEAKKISEDAKAKAWKDFKREYPFADLSKFEAQTDFNEKHATAKIYLKAGPGFWQSVSGSDRRYWSDEMKESLAIGGFPVELSLNYNPTFPVPAVQFEENPESFGELFNQKINIFVSPTEYFTTKFREIFSKTQIKHTTGKESRSWLSGPKMKYWPQQLNFALWCATTGSGISREIMHELSQQLRALYLFHVYFAVRRILYQMGGIQSFSALPGDPTFNQTENKYDSPSYKRICAEFGIDQTLTFVSFTDKIMDWDIVMFQGIHNLTRIGYIHQRV